MACNPVLKEIYKPYSHRIKVNILSTTSEVPKDSKTASTQIIHIIMNHTKHKSSQTIKNFMSLHTLTIEEFIFTTRVWISNNAFHSPVGHLQVKAFGWSRTWRMKSRLWVVMRPVLSAALQILDWETTNPISCIIRMPVKYFTAGLLFTDEAINLQYLNYKIKITHKNFSLQSN